MATLPPRKNPTPTKQHQKAETQKSSLQTLQMMGISKTRAEKALAATGLKSVQLASDWLLAHVNDPFLDECCPREYILYACPTGAFLEHLEQFWEKSKELCGWNGAHNFMPHITLVSFFKAPDDSADKLAKAVKKTTIHPNSSTSPMQLELYTSQNFMGFFVSEDDANFLKRIALQYVKEVSDSILSDTYELDALVACFPWCGGVTSGARCIPRSSRSISLDPHVKSLHLTLAYQFPDNKFNQLKALVEKLDPSLATSWELRLYSRDQRLATKQVHKILYPHTPREPDEIELMIGDYIYLNPDSIKNSSDGWVEGVSWLTGMSGYLPINYTERTAESDAWIMHKTVQLYGTNVTSTAGETSGEDSNQSLEEATSNSTLPLRSEKEAMDPSEIYQMLAAKNISYDLSTSPQNEEKPNSSNSSYGGEKESQKVLIMRHGERVDFTFGSWIPYCFDEYGNYVQKDLNMPKSLPTRKNNILGWDQDSPLTNVGVYQARLVGNSLKENGIKISAAYSSPSFRSVQTCQAIIEQLNQKETTPINLEPGLFEWLAWHAHSLDGVLDWCTAEELNADYFNINANYDPLIKIEKLQGALQENLDEYYERNAMVMAKILASSVKGNVLIVGHASTLDACSRRLCGHENRNSSEMNRLLQRIPYCSLIMMEAIATPDKGTKWQIVEGPCTTVTHSNNSRFDWRILNNAI